jgi:integrase
MDSGMGEMGRTLHRLSAVKVEKLRRQGLHADGGGLYLRITGGSRTWIYRYKTAGKLRDMGLGPTHTLSLREARETAAEQRKLRLQGVDPIERRRATRAAQRVADATAITFKDCGEAYIAAHEDGWHNAKHRQQWRNSLAQHVYPVLGGLPVSVIDTGLVMRVVEPLWKAAPETASRVRGRIENILDWARVRGYRVGENPARWRGHLDHLLPKISKVHKVEHHPALPYTEIGAFMAKLRQETSIAARALEFLILTAARLGEVRGATWGEIDLRNRVWIVPAGRMKAGKEHRVPLSDAAVAVLGRMHNVRSGDFVFFGSRSGQPLGPNALLVLAKELWGPGINVHGFRSSFRDWAAERTNFPREVAEMALAHAIPDAVEAAYRRGDLFDKRRKLMDAWATYCAKVEADSKVVAIRGRPA